MFYQSTGKQSFWTNGFLKYLVERPLVFYYLIALAPANSTPKLLLLVLGHFLLWYLWLLCSSAVCLHVKRASKVCWACLGHTGLTALQSVQNLTGQLSAASHTASLSWVGNWRGFFLLLFLGFVFCFYRVEMSLKIDF